MGHILSRPIRPSLTKIHSLRTELSSLKHANVIYFVGCGFMSWVTLPTSLLLAASLAVVAAIGGVQYLDRTRDSFRLNAQRNKEHERPPENVEETLIQDYKNSHIDIALSRKSFAFSLSQLPFIGISLLGCITTGNILGAALLCAAVGYSTKQTFKSLNRWDDALISKRHLQEDLRRHTEGAPIPPALSTGVLPDLSYNASAPKLATEISEPSLVADVLPHAPARKNKI